MNFGIIKDGKIERLYCGDPGRVPGSVVFPDEFQGYVGQDVREFDESWRLRPLVDRVEEGLVRKEPWEIVDGDEIRPMTEEELYRFGVIEVRPGFKLVDGRLMAMTPYERLVAGIDRPSPGYKVGPSEQEPVVEMSTAELHEAGLLDLEQCIKRMCTSVDSEWARRIERVGVPFDGLHFPVHGGAVAIYNSQKDLVRDGLLDGIIARAVENEDVTIRAGDIARFALAVANGIRQFQDDRVSTKTAIRAAASYEAAEALFDKYMEG